MTVSVSLTPELEQYINEKVSSGAYSSPDDLISDALRMWQLKEDAQEAILQNLTEAQRDHLRREIQKGIDSHARGNYTVVDNSQSAADYAKKIAEESKRRWEAKQAASIK